MPSSDSPIHATTGALMLQTPLVIILRRQLDMPKGPLGDRVGACRPSSATGPGSCDWKISPLRQLRDDAKAAGVEIMA